MKKSLFEQMGGTYTQTGNYLLPNLTLSEEEQKPIGIWGQRHARYLKQNHKVLYMNLLTSGKLNNYLSDIDKQAEDMFIRLVKEMAEKQDVTERLKASDQINDLDTKNECYPQRRYGNHKSRHNIYKVTYINWGDDAK